MDNLCHTLTGAALGEAGLKHRTRFGNAALMIAANLPDIDALAFLSETPHVALRRGWTHGIVAQLLLPVALAGLMVLIDRWRPPASAGARRVRPAAMLALCYAGVLSHVGLDWLNSYGVRLLMPFSTSWFYGDAVFIVDPWLWGALLAGVVLARRRGSTAPARVALALASAYIAVMVLSAAAARERVVQAWTAVHRRSPVALMVGPVPVNPMRRAIIVDAGQYYQEGSFSWWPPRVEFDPERTPKRVEHPAVLDAVKDPDFLAVLSWSRFPRFQVQPVQGGTSVTLTDMRFGTRLAAVTTVVPDQRAP